MRMVTIPGAFYGVVSVEYDRQFDAARRSGMNSWDADEYATNAVNDYWHMHVNAVPEVYCHWCQDYELIEIFDHSTDALIGHYACPKYHGLVYKHDNETKFTETIDIIAPPF